jgi:hypothetical protein
MTESPMRQYNAFFAYPQGHATVTDAINGAVEKSTRGNIAIEPWETMSIAGFKLDDLVRDQIREADVLLADITYPNHNVLYEIGVCNRARKACGSDAQPRH